MIYELQHPSGDSTLSSTRVFKGTSTQHFGVTLPARIDKQSVEEWASKTQLRPKLHLQSAVYIAIFTARV